ncbi:hypothetical protein DRO60_00445 [Candidatus Bathyarchaeota archaeon]|nr:MAG: hypothetical protein DRO60_00445 [Candidatus Bathyarchaeota archaeon]
MGEPEPLRKVKKERGLLERIMSIIPGYHGYKEKELRRESDRLVRMEATMRLREAKDALRKSMSSPFVIQNLSGEDIWMFDTLMARLDRATQRIDRAVAGYAGLFDAVKVREDKLDKVIEHDLMLVERAKAIREKADALAKLKPGTPEWRDAINALISEVDEFDRLIDTRTEVLRGLVD